MPLQFYSQVKYKPEKTGTADWDSFRKGLNSFLRETEIDKEELSKATNLMLTGLGVPTKRWGSANYYMTSNATTRVRALGGYFSKAGTYETISMTDSGFLVKKSSASYTIITGASWASGYDTQMAQLNNNLYVVNEDKEFTKYDGSSLTRFTGLSAPTTLTATNLSGVSGTFTYGWRVTAESAYGETLASSEVQLANLPQDLTKTSIRLAWSTSSPASLVVKYNIYGRDPGNTKLMDWVYSSSLRYDDTGTAEPAILAAPPTADSTAGHKAKYIVSFDSRLILAGIPTNKARVYISGRAENSEKFHWSQGGAYIDIDPDSGDNITGLGIYNEKLIVFKQKSIWQITLSELVSGNYTLTYPIASAITKSRGCVSAKSIAAVENDLFFLSDTGVYVLGYEPNILNVLRTNELSIKIRDFFNDLSASDYQNASAGYIDQKYVISFPSSKKTYIFDRERNAWMGPWTTAYEIHQWYRYLDPNGTLKYLAGTNDGYIVDFDERYRTDRGTAFGTELRTRKEDFGDWSKFKKYRDLFFNLQSVSGNVDIEIIIESRTGQTNVVRSFDVTSASSSVGFGGDGWAENQWADSDSTSTATDISDIVKRMILNKSARSIQVKILTSGASDDYELLGVLINARPQGAGMRPHSWNV